MTREVLKGVENLELLLWKIYKKKITHRSLFQGTFIALSFMRDLLHICGILSKNLSNACPLAFILQKHLLQSTLSQIPEIIKRKSI